MYIIYAKFGRPKTYLKNKALKNQFYGSTHHVVLICWIQCKKIDPCIAAFCSLQQDHGYFVRVPLMVRRNLLTLLNELGWSALPFCSLLDCARRKKNVQKWAQEQQEQGSTVSQGTLKRILIIFALFFYKSHPSDVSPCSGFEIHWPVTLKGWQGDYGREQATY